MPLKIADPLIYQARICFHLVQLCFQNVPRFILTSFDYANNRKARR